MKQLITLLKKDLLMDYSFIFNHKQMGSKKLMTNIFGYGILALFAIIPIRFIMGLFDNPMVLPLKDVLLAQILVSSQIVIIFFFIGSIVSRIYFSNDVNIMLGLPIKASNILLSKILSLTLSALIFSGIFLLPAGFKYGLVSSKGILYYIFLLLGWIFTTAMTIAIMTLIIVAIMRFINRLPNIKNIFQTISMIIVIIFSVGFQVLARTMDVDTNSITEVIKNSESILNSLLIAVPYLRPFINTLTTNDLGNSIMWFFIMSLLTVLILFLVSSLGYKLMLKGIFDNKIIVSGKNKNSGKITTTNPVIAVAKKDIKEILSTPVYIYNVLSGGILMPVLIVLPLITNQDVNISDLLNGNKLFETMGFTNFDKMAFWLLAGLVIAMILSLSGTTSGSALSREGKSMWLMKVLPINYSDIIDGKVLASVALQFLAVIPITILMFVIFRPNILGILAYFIGVISSLFLISSFGMTLGIEHVKLNWDNPQEIIKNTFTSIVNALVCMGYIALFGFGTFNLVNSNTISLNTAKIMLIILIVLNFILGYFLRQRNIKRLETKLITYGE